MTQTVDSRLPRRRSDEEIRAAVAADPDAAPIYTSEQVRRLLAAEDIKDRYGVARLRRRLGLSQVQFANRYRIPLSTLRQWEQGTREPDAATRLLIAVIAEEPALVADVAKRVA
jgi:putative transcriptional regulator